MRAFFVLFWRSMRSEKSFMNISMKNIRRKVQNCSLILTQIKLWEEKLSEREKESKMREFSEGMKGKTWWGCEWATLREKKKKSHAKMLCNRRENRKTLSAIKGKKNRCKVEQTWQWIYYEKRTMWEKIKSSSSEWEARFYLA